MEVHAKDQSRLTPKTWATTVQSNWLLKTYWQEQIGILRISRIASCRLIIMKRNRALALEKTIRS